MNALPETRVLPRAARRAGFRAMLFVGFAFAVMADPVSSVAYTIEASLRALDGHLGLLLPTQILVLGVIALVDVNYWHLVARFPLGGGSPEAAARAFGTGWVFVPIGALIVDFVLTITISIAAAVSALIAYVPGLAPLRLLLGLGMLAFVAALTWFGHGGRLVFAAMTLLFVAAAIVVLVHGYIDPVTSHGRAPTTGNTGPAALAVLLSFPVAMALATGTEAPATAIGQLGQLEADDRRRFARGTLVLTFVIVAALTIGIAGARGAPARGRTGGRLDADRRRRARCRRQRPRVRALPGRQLDAPARCGELIVPGRPRPAQGALAPPRERRRRHPAPRARPHQPPPHALLVGRRLPRRLGLGAARRRRSRAGARAVLRRRRVRQLPRGPGRNRTLLASRGQAAADRPSTSSAPSPSRSHSPSTSRAATPCSRSSRCWSSRLALHQLWVRAGRPAGIEEIERLAEAGD